MDTRQHGFSLIELAMSVAIIGILAAIAFPSYSAYLIRARVSEGLVATGPCRNAVSEMYQSGTNIVGIQPDGWGCNEGSLRPSAYVHVVHTDATGAITITMNPTDPRLGSARGQDIVLTPYGGNLNGPFGLGPYGWICTPGPTMPPEYLPSSCRP